jgi:hypothetical protein
MLAVECTSSLVYRVLIYTVLVEEEVQVVLVV